MSVEEYWRVERYKFLRSMSEELDAPVVTCHHLDDAVETWVWSSLHGEGKIIPVENQGVIRPFLLTEKQELIDYASRNGLFAVDDPYNRENHLIRNYIRCNLLPHAYYVNPGLKKVIKKKYLNGHQQDVAGGQRNCQATRYPVAGEDQQ
jgi:tRNA(Ile)-lysidine synthase